jgi:hypothetical protein
MLPYLVLGILSAAAGLWLAAVMRARARTRGIRVVHCPATDGSASLRVRPVRWLAGTRPGHLRVAECSQWPARRHCAQACLAEIESSPFACSFRRVLAAWYHGRRCAFCQRELPDIRWGELRPALLSPDGQIVSWSEIPPARLYEVLATHRPVCASCDVAETLRRRHADWIVERPREENRGPGAPPA